MTAEEAFDDWMETEYPILFPPGSRKGAKYMRVRQLYWARHGKGKRIFSERWMLRIFEDLTPGKYLRVLPTHFEKHK